MKNWRLLFDGVPKNTNKTTSLGRNIQRLRDARGMTQMQLGIEAGTTSIGMIEAGAIASPRMPTLQAIARALGVTVAQLWESNGSDINEQFPGSLTAFLASPLAKGVTPEEIEHLKRLRARGKRPTETTYYLALQMLRSMAEEEDR
jgi:transcriptional regulator with XRE-family HTH domain